MCSAVAPRTSISRAPVSNRNAVVVGATERQAVFDWQCATFAGLRFCVPQTLVRLCEPLLALGHAHRKAGSHRSSACSVGQCTLQQAQRFSTGPRGRLCKAANVTHHARAGMLSSRRAPVSRVKDLKCINSISHARKQSLCYKPGRRLHAMQGDALPSCAVVPIM